MFNSAPPESADGHAVVVGAGMTGLIVGRVLAEHADAVSILDHDELPEGPESRRGVGQMSHTHFMLHRGREIYEDYFPGLVDECTGPKTGPSDMGQDFLWHQYGTWKPRIEAGVLMWPVDRAELEWAVRRRVGDLDNVEIVPNRKAVDLVWENDQTVGGVTVESETGDENWPAELVVDSMGRGTRTPMLLEKSSGTPVPTQSYDPGVAYSTVDVTEPAMADRDWRGVLLMPESFDSKKLGVTYPISEDRFRVTLGGWCGQEVPMSEPGYREFAADLPSPQLSEILGDVDFVNEPRRYRIPTCEFRRYDDMDGRPDGLLITGDAFCGLNPIYGQGMTVAARQAVCLDQLLTDASAGLPDEATLDIYHRKAASIVEESWMMSAGLDHQFPEVESDMRSLKYIGRLVVTIQRAAGEDPDLYRTLTRMMHMKQTPAALLRPGHLFKIASTGFRNYLLGSGGSDDRNQT
jgi:2-polyprenyl-6-methoxyphenol hydroxylase-like FAD-dependent oxidoreductase